MTQLPRDSTEELALLCPPHAQPITARLAGAGSLRRELEALLAAAPPGASPVLFRDLLLNANAAGKASAAARMWAWKRLKLRYVLDPAVPEFRAFVGSMQETTSPSERGLLCFLMFARTDRLLREVTLECVSPALSREGTVIQPDGIQASILDHARASSLRWSAITIRRAASHLLAALKDFGVLQGSATKRTVRPQPGPMVVTFAARLARLQGLTDRQTLEAQWFRLLGLTVEQVVNLFYAATRSGTLEFRMQADVVEISLPQVPAV